MNYREALDLLWGPDMRAIHGAMQPRKSADDLDAPPEIVVIPLDDELAEALGVPATGYLVAGNGHGN
jgi:hypothetical protein